MKIQRIFLFSISILISAVGFSQQKTDTIKRLENYGIRVGIDISKPVISFIKTDKKGIELTGDIRFLPNYYAATEIGFEDVLLTEDYLNYSTNRQF